jgi:hypothetical protein
VGAQESAQHGNAPWVKRKVNSHEPSKETSDNAAMASSAGTSGRRATGTGARGEPLLLPAPPPPPPPPPEPGALMAPERSAASSLRWLADWVPSQHLRHTRLSCPVREDSSSLRFWEQGSHTTCPHWRQWCLRVMRPKEHAQIKHVLASLSSVHTLRVETHILHLQGGERGEVVGALGNY